MILVEKKNEESLSFDGNFNGKAVNIPTVGRAKRELRWEWYIKVGNK